MFGLHFVVLVMFFLFVVAAAVVVIVVLLTVNRGSRGPASPHSVLSPDGRSWWDGREWKPIPEPPPSPPST